MHPHCFNQMGLMIRQKFHFRVCSVSLMHDVCRKSDQEFYLYDFANKKRIIQFSPPLPRWSYRILFAVSQNCGTQIVQLFSQTILRSPSLHHLPSKVGIAVPTQGYSRCYLRVHLLACWRWNSDGSTGGGSGMTRAVSSCSARRRSRLGAILGWLSSAACFWLHSAYFS